MQFLLNCKPVIGCTDLLRNACYFLEKYLLTTADVVYTDQHSFRLKRDCASDTRADCYYLVLCATLRSVTADHLRLSLGGRMWNCLLWFTSKLCVKQVLVLDSSQRYSRKLWKASSTTNRWQSLIHDAWRILQVVLILEQVHAYDKCRNHHSTSLGILLRSVGCQLARPVVQ